MGNRSNLCLYISLSYIWRYFCEKEDQPMMKKHWRNALTLVVALAIAIFGAGFFATASAGQTGLSGDAPAATPIKHVVVIFQENVSFDQWN
jgi:phospholipase C